MNTDIIYRPIGVISTPFTDISNMPIQPHGAGDTEGVIELDPEFSAGLADIEGFSHLTLLYHFHLVKGYKLYIVPFMDDKPHGIFATRSPTRPNTIGISTVKLTRVEGDKIYFEGADMVSGSPLIDIKPFFPKYDNRYDVKAGWLDEKEGIDITKIKSDARFDAKKSPERIRCNE